MNRFWLFALSLLPLALCGSWVALISGSYLYGGPWMRVLISFNAYGEGLIELAMVSFATVSSFVVTYHFFREMRG